MYLQAQQKNLIITYLSALQFVVHIVLSWAFFYLLDWGVDGAMAALCISMWIVVFGEFVYIFAGWCSDSWKGFALAAFKDIFPVVKLSIFWCDGLLGNVVLCHSGFSSRIHEKCRGRHIYVFCLPQR
ncbi:protein transparent testa 12 [Phtheirospermum japonicum]|uniref:Protein transparent testa 12 n=1 Tax=Phtheirospermum japonicum TaxID=374723 RepID=A0A830AZ68_9LAMI|nr:protein transparent testa 12 [Phtheirospermum japonicum]